VDEVVGRLVDGEDYLEFQPAHAPEILCAHARIHGHAVALIANRRGFLKQDGKPRIGGIVYTESARKVSYFVEAADRAGTPILYLQDVSGFMVGPDAEASDYSRRRGDGGIDGVRHGAEDSVGAESCLGRGLLRDGRAGI
jgi:acetyl-CoA carboxylase carboxyltransferase component